MLPTYYIKTCMRNQNSSQHVLHCCIIVSANYQMHHIEVNTVVCCARAVIYNSLMPIYVHTFVKRYFSWRYLNRLVPLCSSKTFTHCRAPLLVLFSHFYNCVIHWIIIISLPYPVFQAVQSRQLDYSHFISLPLALHPDLVNKLNYFQSSILGEENSDKDGSQSEGSIDEMDYDHKQAEAKMGAKGSQSGLKPLLVCISALRPLMDLFLESIPSIYLWNKIPCLYDST